MHEAMALLVQAHRTMRIAGTDLARLLGVTPKTVYRWYAGKTGVGAVNLFELPRHVYPHDPALAKRIHDFVTRETAGLGLGPPPPLPVPPPPEPALPPEARAPRAMRVEAVVHAVCEALDAGPRTVRPAVLAGFRRALQLALSVDDVVQELAPPRSTRAAASPRKRSAR